MRGVPFWTLRSIQKPDRHKKSPASGVVIQKDQGKALWGIAPVWSSGMHTGTDPMHGRVVEGMTAGCLASYHVFAVRQFWLS